VRCITELGFAQKTLSFLSAHSVVLRSVPPPSLRFFGGLTQRQLMRQRHEDIRYKNKRISLQFLVLRTLSRRSLAVKNPHTIKSTKPLTLPLLAFLEVSPEIACNYISSHYLLPLVGTLLSDYP